MRSNLFFPLTVLTIAVLGCSTFREAINSGQTNSASNVANSNASSTGQSEAVANSGNPEADINAMADRFLSQRSFRAKMTGTGDKDTRTDLEFVAPDRFRIRTGPGMETIIIGKDMYLSMGDKFQKIPGAMPSSVPDLRTAFDKEGRKWFSDVRFVGEETANGRPSLVYEYKNKGPGHVGENDSKIWIAKDDGLPVKIEARYKNGPLKTMLIEYDYDPNIKIEPPATK